MGSGTGAANAAVAAAAAAEETPSLGDYLRQVRDKRPTRVVMGNEAGDLDSIASSLVYAYVTRTEGTVVAMLRMGRDELALRGDARLALRESGIDEAVLRWLPEEEEERGDAVAQCELVLVDHNALCESAARRLRGRVVGVLDHHEDERRHLDASPRVVTRVGSCATLVAEEARASSTHLPADAARLLLAALLSDVGVNATGSRATPRDAAALKWTMTAARIDATEARNFGHRLHAAKHDVSALSASQLLRRDLKTVQVRGVRAAVASVPVRADEKRLSRAALAALAAREG
ncbi:unnamed protein product, partial [Agarophyton chilense]